MALLKLEIDNKRIIADSSRTILEVARENGIHDIPTLCHDDRLEPFASCFLCVVKVQGARSLLPACSTKVTAGMVVDTRAPEVMKARKACLELLLSNHYADCIGPCQTACPAGIDIQGYIALAALGKYTDAIRLIKEKNPLPAICGRVCTRPCEVTGCRRPMLDEAVGIDYIKRYVADIDIGSPEPFRPQVAAPQGKTVAVVGAGPAGLSAAYYLAVRGYKVDILETLPEAGGMLRYGIPEYRLPKEVLDAEVAQILELGVTLTTNAALGADFTVTSLKEKGYGAIFLGLGAWDSTKMRVKDEDVPGVIAGIDFLKEVGLHKKLDVKGKVLVVGGGNTAIDCARTSLRLGAKEVHILYRRTRAEMPANASEIHEADEEGISLDFLVAPQRVVTKDGRAVGLECLKMELGDADASGRRSPKPVKGSEFVVEGDLVIAAIGQGTKMAELFGGKVPGVLPPGETLGLTKWQTVQVNDRTFETTVDGVFAGGDVATGAATVVEAVAAGRKAAYAIDKYLTTGRAQAEPVEFFSRKDTFRKVSLVDLRSQEKVDRRRMPVLTPEVRSKAFIEVEQGYARDDVWREAARCLECGCTALFTCDLRKYATDYGVDIKRYMGEASEFAIDRSHPFIDLDPNKCVLCGRCVRICTEVVGVAAYGFINRGFSTVVKPTLGGSLLETECVSCGLCIGTCPTAAIAPKTPLVKPGPWRADGIPAVCHYCGVGCSLNCDVYGDTLLQMSTREGGATAAHHCKKGLFGSRYVQATDRLASALLRTGSELVEVPLEKAVEEAGSRLKDVATRHGGDSVAVFVSPRMSNEEAYLAQKLARVGLGTHQVSTLSQLVNRELASADVFSSATYGDVERAQALLVVGSNLDEEHPVAGLFAKRALRGGGQMIYVGSAENRTAYVASIFLKCKPGTEAWVALGVLAAYAATAKVPPALDAKAELSRVMAGLTVDTVADRTGVSAELLGKAAAALAGAKAKVVVCNRDYRGPRVAGDVRLYAELASAIGASLLAMHETANMQGLCDVGVSPAWLPGYAPTEDDRAVTHLEKAWGAALKGAVVGKDDVLARLTAGKIKAALVLGEDPLGCESFPKAIRDALAAVELLVVGDVTLTATARAAQVVLPLSAMAETSGTFTNQERRVQSFRRAVPAKSGVETWELLCQLGARMGQRFKMAYASPAEVFAEICRVVPMYAGVALRGDGDGVVWDATKLPALKTPLGAAGLEQSVMPVATQGLDALQRRFAEWFEQAMAAARRAHEERQKAQLVAPVSQ